MPKGKRAKNKKWPNFPHTDEELLDALGMLASLQDVEDPRVTPPSSQRVVRSQQPRGEQWGERAGGLRYSPKTRWLDEDISTPMFERPIRQEPNWPAPANFEGYGDYRGPGGYRDASDAVKQMRLERQKAQFDRWRRMRNIKQESGY